MIVFHFCTFQDFFSRTSHYFYERRLLLLILCHNHCDMSIERNTPLSHDIACYSLPMVRFSESIVNFAISHFSELN